ncbi:uncharacterized protein EHS24_005076 [Apiotrichum porosum]|uniref:Glycosyl hydrolase family 88 n=1 Tax=Apiotrichum porosum TaxID=105984 RepID=A0A427Y6T1_9TREE|nr:uncharacterized protein EHS24_005076 [Apiotrichum porosum]RSH86803.1 hypothetical protein EHS24_005076 [Apiotrichum porosum]
MDTLLNLPASFPELYAVSDSIKVVEAAKKYGQQEPIDKVPHYTTPQGSHAYWCQDNETSWTQGFFVGLLWDLVERQRLLPNAVESSYTEQEITDLARRYQDGFKWMANPASNHDQGFRFQLSYGKDLDLTDSKEAKAVVIDAADSLVDRFDPQVGAIRSWDRMVRVGQPDIWREDNLDEHYLTIIDNMASSKKRLNLNRDGTVGSCLTHQGYQDESTWSRGQAWAIHGFAQVAQRTGRKDFIDLTRKLTDKFLSLLPESGVPWWDFDAPRPCPYDASAATIAACGMLILFQILRPTDPTAAEAYLERAFQLVRDVLRECKTGEASLKDVKVDFGEGEWETILEYGPVPIMDHGLVFWKRSPQAPAAAQLRRIIVTSDTGRTAQSQWVAKGRHQVKTLANEGHDMPREDLRETRESYARQVDCQKALNHENTGTHLGKARLTPS